MGPLLPRFERHTKGGKYFVSPGAQTVRTPAGSYFEFQQGGGCAGFSSAFVLRHSGVQIGGEEAFKDVPFQMKGGLAFPKGITGFFKKRGIKMTACSGNFAALQNELGKVIEPALNTAPTSGESVYYNRTIPVEEFKKLWNTSMLKMPLYRNMFFVCKD